MSKTIPLSDEHNEHDDTAGNLEKALKQKLKDSGVSKSWMDDHLIIDFPND